MEIGSTWHGWTVEKVLGKGSFGKVYKIVKQEYGYTYESALKVICVPQNAVEVEELRNEGMDDDAIRSYYQEMMKDIVAELALMSQLRGNTNIVSYEDHYIVENDDSFGWKIYLRMEMLQPFFAFIKKHKMTVKDALQLGKDICKALSLCESNNIIHRDIKLDNIFISKQGDYELGDFGIARHLEKATAGMSKKGTVAYMPPEVYKGQECDSTVDIYSLGLVLYRLFNNNRNPFQPAYPRKIVQSESENANMMRMIGEKIPDPCNAGDKLSGVIIKACSYRPEDRYQTAEDMYRDLDSIVVSDSDNRIIFPHSDLSAAKEPTAAETNADHEKKDKITEKDKSKKKTKDNDKETEEKLNDNKSDLKKADEITPIELSGSSLGSSIKGHLAIIFAALLSFAVIASLVGGYLFYYPELPDNMVGSMGKDKAEKELEAAGFKVKIGKPDNNGFDDSIKKGIVKELAVKDKVIKEKSRVKRGTIITVVLSRGPEVIVPSFKGMTSKKAKKAATKLKLKLKVAKKMEASEKYNKGQIIKQNIKKGEAVEEGTAITVTKCKYKLVVVPDVTGKGIDEARTILEGKGLICQTVLGSYGKAAGIVLGQDKKAGEKVPEGDAVVLTVSRVKQVRQRSYRKQKKKSDENWG